MKNLQTYYISNDQVKFDPEEIFNRSSSKLVKLTK